jgi:DNA-binding MarR family transcriptional regulator
MRITEELHISKPLEPGHELALSVLLTREHLTRLLDERVFKSAGLTDQQFNVLRILKGGPAEGYTIGEIRRRVIYRNADVPRLVDRLMGLGLVARQTNPSDRRSCHVRLTPEGEACQAELSPAHASLLKELEALLSPAELGQLLELLERLREGIRGKAAAADSAD